MTPLTLADIIANSRLCALREAVVAGLRALIPEIEVKSHPGKVDISDVIAADVFATPSIVVALTRYRPDPRMSGAEDLCATVAAYVIVENMIVGGRMVKADEIGPALCGAISHFLSQPNADPLWGLEDIGLPDDVEGQPVFTAKTVARGAAFYAVTWKQVLYAQGEPLFGGGFDV